MESGVKKHASDGSSDRGLPPMEARTGTKIDNFFDKRKSMSTITLENVRACSDITMKVRLKDNGVAVDWSGLTDIKALVYSDDQKAVAGRCAVSVDSEDPTVLVCLYAATKPQYLGVNSIIVRAKYMGREKTYDKQAVNIVARTAELEGEQVVLEDPEVTVDIEVVEVDSSILDAAIAAAFDAADKANEAAEQIPLQVLTEAREATAAANTAAAAANAAGITSVQASIADNEPGTPSVDAALLNKVLSLVFHHLKGEKGDTGATPNITVGIVTTGEPGTPVVVTMTGTAAAPVLNITIPQGAKGEQGNTGSSVDYPFELVNNLTTDDATKALTAAQGKLLDGKVSQLRQEVDEKLDGVEVTNPVWLWVITDKDGRVLGGVKADGSIEWAIGIPKPIKDELDSLTLTVAGKVNKVVGKSLIDSIVADATISFDNPDYLYLMTDENGKIVIGIKKDGKLYADIAGIPADVQEEVDDLQGQINDITSGAEGEEKYFQLSEQSNNIIDVIGFSSFKEKTMTIISPDKYSCWPRIGKVGNKLVCAYVKALEHEDPHNGTGAIWVSTSANGIVWTPKRLIIDTENVRDGVTGCGNDENGNLLFINRVGYPGDANTYQEIYKTTNGIDFELISTIPASTPLGHIGDIINVPTKGLMAFFGEYGNDSAPWGYILSSDNGETWTKVVVESVVREQRPMEMSGVYLGNGKILVAGRYEGSGSAYMWQMQSEDYGETWTKQATNISGNSYTPSLVFDQLTNKVSLYIYNRGTGELEYRLVNVEDIWNNPTGWPTATIISTGATGQDAGNVSAVAFKGSQFAAYYSGNSTDTGIYETIV